jgi:hypothetical protein
MYFGSKPGFSFQWNTRSVFVGIYFEETGALNDSSLNLGICVRCLLRQINIPVKIDKITIADIKK